MCLSTHDLTRRSTISENSDMFRTIFQLTTSHGGRRRNQESGRKAGIFQLTTSHGGRRIRSLLPDVPEPFNSRPHTEVDRKVIVVQNFHDLSTHDLTRRSTGTSIPKSFKMSSFNSRPHTEVDDVLQLSADRLKPFNSRPHTEVDSRPAVVTAGMSSFNSRPHTEVDCG